MKKIFPIILLVILISSFTSDSFKSYPQDYFRSPVSYPLRLSGTFGELRPNHLHAGIDIKPPSKSTGDPIYAVADGYVSRIKVSPRGYGNCLYIDHPNGYTSVYAHLQKFTDSVATYIKEQQYNNQSFEQELFPERDKFSFKKGELIGKLGLSGRSYGAHLHFEMRDTKTEKAINPLLFGLKVTDNLPPKLHQLKLYKLDPEYKTLGTHKYNLLKGKSNYYIKGDTLVIGAWRVGLAVKAFDHMNYVSNWNGPYSVELVVDDQPVYGFKMETFAFSETRYLNAHLDYEEQVTKKSYFHRCFKMPGNQLSIYEQAINDGVIPLAIGQAKKIEIISKDVAGNTATLKFFLRRGIVKPIADTKVYNYTVPYNSPSAILGDGADFFFKEGTFYENAFLHYHVSQELAPNIHSAIHSIGEKTIPIHKHYEIRITPTDLPPELREKAVIAVCENQNLMSSLGGTWEDDELVAKARKMGDFCITTDLVKPTITPLNVKSWMGKGFKISFRIKDDFSGIKSYKATVDDEWVLMEYDEKNNLLFHRFDGKFAKGKHNFVLTVTDNRNNVSTYSKAFSN